MLAMAFMLFSGSSLKDSMSIPSTLFSFMLFIAVLDGIVPVISISTYSASLSMPIPSGIAKDII